jgi:hypothetical protein
MVRRSYFRFLSLLFVFSSLGLFLLSPISSAQERPSTHRNVSGKILNAQTDAPVAGVNISVAGTALGTASDSSGSFNLRAPLGDRQLLVQHIGYQPERLSLHTTNIDTFLTIRLIPRPVALPDVQVEAMIDTPAIGSFRLHGKDLKDIPDFTGEAYAAMKTLPSVASNFVCALSKSKPKEAQRPG